MWLFITSRIRTWLVLAVVVPVLTSLIHLVRVRLEAKNPHSRIVKAMKTVEDLGHRRSRRKPPAEQAKTRRR